jgi:stage II sporulation protein GA (sporulation sigma-E factor processing peptidase)
MVVAGTAIVLHYLGYSVVIAGYAGLADQPGPATIGGVLVACGILGAGMTLFRRFLQARGRLVTNIVPVEIRVGTRKVEVPGLLDTGNSVSDPLTGLPAVLVEFDAVSELLPAVLHGFFKDTSGLPDSRRLVTLVSGDPSWARRIRMLPCSSIVGGRRLIPGFVPDVLRVGVDRRGVVGVIPAALDSGRGYRALINPRLLETAGQHVPSARVTPSEGFKATSYLERG